MKSLFLCICIFLSLIPIDLWGQSKVNKQSCGQKVAGYISLLTADSIKFGIMKVVDGAWLYRNRAVNTWNTMRGGIESM